MTQHKYEPGGFFPCTICGEFENHLNHEIFDNKEDNKPGLTEADRLEDGTPIATFFEETPEERGYQGTDDHGAYVEYVRHAVVAAIAAEARAPLEEQIRRVDNALRKAHNDVNEWKMRSTQAHEQLAAVTAERDERPDWSLVAYWHEQALKHYRDFNNVVQSQTDDYHEWGAQIKRAEDAERQLEEMRWVIKKIHQHALNIGAGKDSKRIFELCNDALTPPASTEEKA